VRVTLELEGSDEPIRGVARAAGGEHAFTGWLGLARALEAFLADGRPGPLQRQSGEPEQREHAGDPRALG
jgi:hypothetical protein